MKSLTLKFALAFCSLTLIMNSSNAQNYQWAKNLGGTATEAGNAIAIDASGNVYTTGKFQGTADFDPGTGTSNLTSYGADDIFICKLNNQGNFVWAKQMGGSGIDRGYAIALDVSGNVFITGYFNGTADFDPGSGTLNLTSAGAEDVFIAKLTSAGNLVWAKRIGGTDVDKAASIAVDASGNVCTTGTFAGISDFDPGTAVNNLTSSSLTLDIFVSKLNSNGDFVWAKRFGIYGLDEGHGITTDATGNVYVTGEYLGTVDFDPGTPVNNLVSIGIYDIFVLKLDAGGNYVWAKSLGGNSYDVGDAIAVDASGNVYTTGIFEGDADFDPGTASYNLSSDGGANVNDIFVSKLNSSGNFVWARRLGSPYDDEGNAIAVDGLGNVYTTGCYRGDADFDPGTQVFNLRTNLGTEVFISKLDGSGNFVWAKNVGGGADDDGFSIAVDAAYNVYVTGEYQGATSTDFDPGTAIVTLYSNGGYDAFVLKLGKFTAGITQSQGTKGFTFSPNPVTANMDVDLVESPLNSKIFITDVYGKVVYSLSPVKMQKMTLNLSFLSRGIYFVRLENGERNEVTKFVKE